MNVASCYSNAEEKRRKFPAVVIPALFDEAARGAHDRALIQWLAATGVADAPRGLPQLAALHEAARAGLYVPSRPANCDPPQPVDWTLARGGDCDQWAAVILAALRHLGYPASLWTFGDGADNFQHVAAAALWGARWRVMDAKGDARGLDFAQIDPSYPVVSTWGANGWLW